LGREVSSSCLVSLVVQGNTIEVLVSPSSLTNEVEPLGISFDGWKEGSWRSLQNQLGCTSQLHILSFYKGQADPFVDLANNRQRAAIHPHA
jgi:hypothetical protein